ncbi:hypothetical protein EDB83DRAFT_2321345 [Lactarius deliciosus]|nr:hypothetical protein EDB83DRAFT_2321345 [Lactarius deliciosus]
MNWKKTGTGPDRNRWQLDLRLRFIRPEKFTGCGSSKFGKWVNRHRAATTIQQRRLRQRRSNANYDHHSDTRADFSDADVNASDRPQQQQPQKQQPRITNQRLRPSINTDHSCTHNTPTTTAMTKTTLRQLQPWPQRQDFNISNGDTSTAATSTNRRGRRSAATTTRQQPRPRPRQPYIGSRNDDMTTAATSTHQQPQRQSQQQRVDNHDPRRRRATTVALATASAHRQPLTQRPRRPRRLVDDATATTTRS